MSYSNNNKHWETSTNVYQYLSLTESKILLYSINILAILLITIDVSPHFFLLEKEERK